MQTEGRGQNQGAAVTREEAVAVIEQCIQIHRDWAEYQMSHPNWQSEIETKDVGLPEYHEEWIRKYEDVLTVLRAQNDQTH